MNAVPRRAKRGRRLLVVVAVAAAAIGAAAIGFAAAGIGSGGSGDSHLGGPMGLAVLERPVTAADRELRAEGYGALVSKTRSGNAERDELRLLRRSGEDVVVLVATEQPTGRGPAELGVQASGGAGVGIAFGRFKEVCVNYATGGLSNIACGDRREFLRGGIAGISQSAVFPAETKEEDVMEAPGPFVGPDGKPVPAHFYGLVPNAVAKVEQTFSGGVPSAKGSVKGNFYDVVSAHPEAPDRNGKVLWFDEDGKAIPR